MMEVRQMSIADKTKDIVIKSRDSIINTIDANENGEIDIEDFIILGLRTPGIRVNRSDFLKKELLKNYPQEVIDDAISYNPAHAKIPVNEIDKIADEVIKFERNCVSGISTALGMPGGVAMVATIPADIVQYYSYMLRATQKLMYLYGFPEIDTNEKGQKFDSETMNLLIICLGVMYGVQGTSNAIRAMARALGTGVEKKLLKTALTKGTIYPIVKSVSKWFGIHMTKEVFAGFFKKAIPVVGGVIGGGITYLSFKPCCNKLKESLQDTLLSNPEHRASEDEYIIVDAIEQPSAE
ncbi:MAG: EcsC family protein [Lachnospiraceae bacterium]|nr:EcsC family protein [Lachnospiraceae bacterium]